MDRYSPPAMNEVAWPPIGLHLYAIDLDTMLWSPQGEISAQAGDVISDQMVELARAHRHCIWPHHAHAVLSRLQLARVP